MNSILKATLLVAVAAAAAACSNTAEQFAKRIRTAVANNDKEALIATDKEFRKMLIDSGDDDLRGDLASTAEEETNDTLRTAILAIAETPKAIGKQTAEQLIANPDNENNRKAFIETLGLTRYVYTMLDRTDDFLLFNAAYQGEIDKLPIERQMKVYTAIAGPRLLGEVMADDVVKAQGTPQADSIINNVNLRIHALKKLYTPAEYEQMKEAFGRLILTTDAAMTISSFKF